MGKNQAEPEPETDDEEVCPYSGGECPSDTSGCPHC